MIADLVVHILPVGIGPSPGPGRGASTPPEMSYNPDSGIAVAWFFLYDRCREACLDPNTYPDSSS